VASLPILSSQLASAGELYVRQVRELAELFGFETRNKYAIVGRGGEQIAYAAEQRKGLLGALIRQFLGHWRTFDIVFFDNERQPLFRAVHPFRFFFQRLEVFGVEGRPIGALQQRWGFFTKKFDVLDSEGRVLFEMRSGLFSPWTYPFFREGQQHAVIEKKWSGALSELFTDRDNFRVRYLHTALRDDERLLILAAALFVDLQYFERRAGQDA
jgi:hypothetical protein